MSFGWLNWHWKLRRGKYQNQPSQKVAVDGIAELARAIGEMALAQDQFRRDYIAQEERIERIQVFLGSVETAGVTRKFGGRIDVDFDRFLNQLGTGSEAELARVIASRKAAKARAKRKK